MRTALFLLPTLAAAQFQVPGEVQQGYALRIDGQANNTGLTVEFLGKKIRMYAAENSGAYGLMPVPVMQAPGEFPLIVRASGEKIFEQSVKVLDAHYPEQNISTTRQMRSLKSSDDEIKRMAAFRASTGEKKMWTEPLARPAPECMNSPFGVKRRHDGKLTGNFHGGLDFRSPPGRAVHAAEDGVVKVARMFPRQGGTVGIDHGQGVQTTYIHLSRLGTLEGRAVKRDQVIGYVGSTGFATGPHLHWTVHVHGVPVNPLQWVPGIAACGSLD